MYRTLYDQDATKCKSLVYIIFLKLKILMKILFLSVTPNIMSSNNKVVSLTPPDPSLTPANLLHATCHISLWESEDSYNYLHVPKSQHNDIVGKFDGEEAKQQLFTTWLASHPCPSWEQVRNLLRGDRWRGGVGGEEGERAAHEVEETYLKSELYIINPRHTCTAKIISKYHST